MTAAARVLGDDVGQPLRLIVGQRVHRVEDQRLGAGDPVPSGPQHMVEDRVQERLGLAGAGAGGDQRRLRTRDAPGDRGRQPGERRRLMPVRREPLVPLQRVPPAVVRRAGTATAAARTGP